MLWLLFALTADATVRRHHGGVTPTPAAHACKNGRAWVEETMGRDGQGRKRTRLRVRRGRGGVRVAGEIYFGGDFLFCSVFFSLFTILREWPLGS